MAFVLPAFVGCGPASEQVETLEQAAEEPRQLVGETITVEGRVAKVLGDCAFELGNGNVLDPSRVLTLCDPAGQGEPAPEVPADVRQGDWLRVTGVAGELTREAYEYKTTLTLPEDVFEKTETRSVIFVASAEKVDKPSEADQAELPEAPLVVPIL